MPNWFKSLFAEKIFGVVRSPQWSKIRDDFILQNPNCAVCGVSKRLEVHHVIPVQLDKSKELSVDNLLVLCREHHFTFGHLCSWYSYNTNVKIDSIEWNKKITKRP